ARLCLGVSHTNKSSVMLPNVIDPFSDETDVVIRLGCKVAWAKVYNLICKIAGRTTRFLESRPEWLIMLFHMVFISAILIHERLHLKIDRFETFNSAHSCIHICVFLL